MSEKSYLTVYYLGPDGSNAHNAMLKLLEKGNLDVSNYCPKKSIKMAIEAIENDKNAICVLPIENSIEGIVRETIDNLSRLNDNSIRIQAEICLPIKHMLLSTGSDISQITEIYSHPQALFQCGKYLYKELGNAQLKETPSTSYAAEFVSKQNNKTIAAIANETCAKLFNLNILKEDINDETDNKTRFYLLGRKAFYTDESNKTAIIVSTKNEPGSLCSVLKVFEKNNINLSYIDSRPSKRELGEYIFFMELDGYENSESVKKALSELPKYTNFIKILGSYKKYN